ncbi:hypothetical protein ACSTB0_13555, partial [Faecalibacterium wellingii]
GFRITKLFLIERNVGILLILQFHHLGDDGLHSGIVFHKLHGLDRFARNRYDSARYKTQLKKNGVKLMSATDIISDGPGGSILE